jgi:indolepyruvate ferredoxin oxidoreductase
MLKVMGVLAKGRKLRGTVWDVFGYTSERKTERRMIADYEKTLDLIAAKLTPQTHATATALAGVPMEIRGFGHVKLANHEKAKVREEELKQALDDPGTLPMAAE